MIPIFAIVLDPTHLCVAIITDGQGYEEAPASKANKLSHILALVKVQHHHGRGCMPIR